PGSLGTNDITVGAQGAFETTYNVNNTNANLFINGGGRVYLHQTHTFKTVVIGGVPLAAGNYTFAQLNSSYPTNFPATWPVQNGGASPAVGSGSITVLVTPAPSIATQPVSITNYAGQTASFICIPNGTPPLTLLWYKGATGLSDGGRLFGSGTTNLVITNIVAGDAGNYTFVVSNIYGSATSSVASLTVLPLTILTNPVSLSLYAGMTAQFNVTALGNTPLTYQWRKGGVGVSNGGNVSGADTASLVITNVGGGNAGNYDVIVTSPFESATSTVASLSILPPAVNLTLNYGGNPIQEAQGLDWDSPTNWSDGFAASTSAAFNPGVSYEVPAGARLRSPAASDASSFPGQVLKIDGSGVWVNGSDATIGEVRFKHNDGGTVFIPRLVMNGGELDTGDNGVVILRGRIDILANTPIYVDSAANLDRSYQIDSFLTGNGTIEFHQFSASLSNNTLNVTGTTNTFSGNWNIVQGTVLGSGNNSLGSGNINIEGGGALETLYDINSPNSSLTNNGQMFLHRNDTFGAVYINGTPLANGTYSFATLNATYPGNFPASWATQRGSTVNTGSGSITVVGIRPSIGASFSGAQLTLSWPSGYYLIEANNVTGPWTTNTSATSPLIVTPTAPKHFYGLQPQ
ncbi:MAG TPA: immunoglobulin domain-containing protein, partial [Candidatus Dormibacteraeota bacterium]|nr:immunoglobulin domain-containing protein [Candidatus Dormibacteraeota bacterium]